ncbi:pleckstrin homology domain-containing family M member 2-like isoform X1 [Salvelinus fontinalis]|uniref:pleckstrin homology domain-containing family M member 2-like isoform X1 n=2 Tax=Salvelinus fontinalis TaxID=8038 RepID=UPI002485618B|nr:pleckstrin homology domain-containing family M member 2-like isoform X1 [Salvelinus fontinalis]XP_055748468.1 pleckstrin homology domain-containing family M member 2-like isoform X1 [Salvelinus fontinalis]
MDQLKVKDRILENISSSVKKLQSYFAACEDETPAIRNHDRVLQRLCEHLDHALLYGLQDISSGYWVLVLHFTRREAVRQVDELQHIATNLGRSRAWLYLALSESSLESYLRLFQENQGLLQKYYFKNALVCSHDHLTLFLTLVSGLEFIRFHLELDVPYLDVAPYMPEYYKPQNLLDFEERLPSSDSLSLLSFTSLTSTNLEWDDSAIAPSSEDYDFGDIFPVLQPTADWEEGDLTDPVICPRSSASDPQMVFKDSVILRAAIIPVRGTSPPRSPTRHNPFNKDSDTNTSADITPVHTASRHPHDTTTTVDDMESTSNELEVIRMARRRKPAKKRHVVKGSSASTVSSEQNTTASEQAEGEDGTQERGGEGLDGDSRSPSVGPPQGSGAETVRRRRGMGDEEGQEENESEGLLRLPEMTDTSMDSVGQPLRDVMDRLNGALDGGQAWWRPDREEEDKGEKTHQSSLPRRSSSGSPEAIFQPPGQQPFRGDPIIEPPDPEAGAPLLLRPALAPSPNFLQAPPAPADFYCFIPHNPDAAATRGGHHDTAGHGQPQALPGGHEDEREAEAPPGQDPFLEEAVVVENGLPAGETEEDSLSPTENSHSAEFKVDNNHLLLLMIHVFRETEEQLFKMVRMSTGHMEGDMQPLYLLLTDCYIYLLRKGAAEKPYTVEDAISYNELDYVSVGVDQQTVTLVCTNRRRQFLLDTSDSSLTIWFLAALKSAMIKGCREPPYPSVLTDATMEKLALTKFVSQESHCEVSEVVIRLYSLVHWEDPMDVTLAPQTALVGAGDSSSTKEGPLLYRAGTTYLGKELWKSCYLVLSNGNLYQYTEKSDATPLMSITMGGEHCGGCRRSNSTELPHAFQVILTERPPLVLSADNEGDMSDWMLVLCQSVSKGVIPQGVAPTPCIPCCLVVTDRELLTCHQDCQTSFFRSLGGAELSDISSVSLEDDKEYCVVEFALDRAQYLPPWVLYFSGCEERDRLLEALESAWRDIFQVCLPRRRVSEQLVQKRCGDALALMRSAWQRSDSLARGRAQREPWC